ncbi:LacI family DNA-binding transcriptional regulator [Marinivivus vitaminiproducens]|uniref:LacI family DNA-binding transcriptional regulator n=1 Tax=Marinivivus vitaminiproducens TaxID=3035935 RepID=UPI0027A7D4F7|nr:LacI family DNA-binding transcriptional regulator [Geminicoccaceae bacterium SCSIO 64248]
MRKPANGAWSTMEDVARRAGVSTMTVSRALRTPDKVAPATRARIEAAVAEFGYLVDRGAGALSARRSGLVAALISTLSNSIFAATVEGLSQGLKASGHEILLGTTDYSEHSEEELLRAALSRRPDGILLTNSVHTTAGRKLLQVAGIPVVETWNLPAQPIDMVVGFSNRDAARTMTLALHDWGYRRIAFLASGPRKDWRMQRRRAGYRAAMAACGLDAGREVVVVHPGSTIADGARAFERLIERHPDTDAVFCAVDSIAAGAAMAARRRGMTLPGDIAISGFGDLDIADADALDLTTVRVPRYAIGAQAGAMLAARISGDDVPCKVVDVGYEVVRRGST